MIFPPSGILDTSIVERGRNIVSCSRDGTAKLWDCGTKQCLGTFSECGGSVNSCSVGHVNDSVDLGQPDSTPSTYLGDNCIESFHLWVGGYIVGYTVGKSVL